MRYILTDIEGTTTSVAFVYEVLFPYFKKHVAEFLRDRADDPEVERQGQSARQTVEQENGLLLTAEGLAQQLIYWTDADRKHPALKVLQGMVWKKAYEKGEIRGQVYADVPPALARWQQAGFGLGVYSSGSVEAQHLLFGFSEFGDLKPYFSHYFDTQIGMKRELSAYRNIAAALQLLPADILFLSDIEAELDAAAAAGMGTIQLLRPGTVPAIRHCQAADFSAIDLFFDQV